MLNEEVTKAEIKKIVNDEMKKIVSDEISKQLATIRKGAGKDEIQNAIKNALNNLYKFMWTKRSTWNNELK